MFLEVLQELAYINEITDEIEYRAKQSLNMVHYSIEPIKYSVELIVLGINNVFVPTYLKGKQAFIDSKSVDLSTLQGFNDFTKSLRKWKT